MKAARTGGQPAARTGKTPAGKAPSAKRLAPATVGGKALDPEEERRLSELRVRRRDA